MGPRKLDVAIWQELKLITGRRNMRIGALREYSRNKQRILDSLQSNEEYVYCPALDAHCAIVKDKRKGRK